MGCGSCGTGGLPGGCKNNGWCKSGGCGSILDVHDWLSNVYFSEGIVRHKVVEVKFKGTRKEYFRNTASFELEIGDAIVVESSTGGYDVGYVSLTSYELVQAQMRKYSIDEDSPMMKRIVRMATESDLAKFEEAKALEYTTMMSARNFARDLGLVMKISDVEFQGDRTKATFFYTAEGRVDFRELIKLYAKEFKCKVEMRQIGLRQEAGRLGGIGSCGRELCCSTWLTDFNSVPTMAARYQNLFLNPLKLSGQCGRLKCCLNYELDTYIEALDEFPDENTTVKTAKGIARIEKMDILKRIVWLRYKEADSKYYPLQLEKLFEIMDMNKRGVEPTDLDEFQAEEEMPEVTIGFKDVVGEERLDRFERKGGRGGKPKNRNTNNNNNRNRPNNNNRGPAKPIAEGAIGETIAAAVPTQKQVAPQTDNRPKGPRPERGPNNNNNRRDNRPRGNNNNNRPPREGGGPAPEKN
jgi:cell fate regulator YaaT (PSP1 superfamily)